jgi:hypothetical protein
MHLELFQFEISVSISCLFNDAVSSPCSVGTYLLLTTCNTFVTESEYVIREVFLMGTVLFTYRCCNMVARGLADLLILFAHADGGAWRCSARKLLSRRHHFSSLVYIRERGLE